MLATVGAHGYGTYLIFGSFCVCMFFFVWFYIPETKGMLIPHLLNSHPHSRPPNNPLTAAICQVWLLSTWTSSSGGKVTQSGRP